MASPFAAIRPVVVATLCLIGVAQGLSLVHLRTDTWLSSSSVDAGQAGPPDTSEVMSVLENINGSLDKIEEVITTANSTAYAMVDGLMQAIAGVQGSLTALSAASSASSVLGAEDVETQVNNFIGKANATLQKVQAKVPATLDTFSEGLFAIMPELTSVADAAFSKFVDALKVIVNDIYNTSAVNESMRLTEAGSADEESIKKVVHKARNAHKHASRKSLGGNPRRGSKAHRHGSKASAPEAVALLRERVFQDVQAASASNVDGAVWPKKQKASPPKKATKETKQANTTLEALFDKIAKTNGTVSGLLDMALDAASAAIDDINATVAPALAELPGSLAQPVSFALDTLLTTRKAMVSDVQSKVGELQGLIQTALETLAEVVPLADELLAAIDEAIAAKSNVTAGADAGESNATAETDATDSTSTAAPEAEADTSTAAPDAAESTSTAGPEAAESTSTAISDAAEGTSTAAPETAGGTSTAAPDAAESTSIAAPEAEANTSTAAPDAAESSSTAAPEAAESTSTAVPDAAEGTSTAAPEAAGGTSTAAPDAAQSTSTAAPEAEANTSTAAPDAAESSSTSAPEVAESTSTATPGMAESTSTAVPDAAASTSTAAPETAASPSTASPDSSTITSSAAPDVVANTSTVAPSSAA